MKEKQVGYFDPFKKKEKDFLLDDNVKKEPKKNSKYKSLTLKRK